MRKNIDLTTEEYNAIINQFYKYFESGYKFEEFLKIFLEKIGLEEVFVTKKSRDGGIDLTAVRKGIGDFSNSVDEPIYIQAKRYSPSVTVPPEKIRALRGSFNSGQGMFITTGKVSDNAKSEARNADPSRPVIVVDGRELVSTCIDKEIGFIYKPVFSKPALDVIMGNEHSKLAQFSTVVERVVTENDIKAYILVLPKIVREKIGDSSETISIRFGDSTYKDYNIDAGRRYVGGIAKIYRDFGLRQADGAFVSKKSVWHIEADGRFTVEFKEI